MEGCLDNLAQPPLNLFLINLKMFCVKIVNMVHQSTNQKCTVKPGTNNAEMPKQSHNCYK